MRMIENTDPSLFAPHSINGPACCQSGSSKKKCPGETSNKMGTDLKQIPGVGANMAQHLNNIGILWVEDLVGKDPEELYQKNCLKKGYQDDKCVLYVFRCAVYFAEHKEREAEKLKWWYWKDKEYPEKKEGEDTEW